jgi:hypothetical protein
MAEPLTTAAIIEAIERRKREVQSVDVPEWGGTVYVRRMTTDDFEASGLNDKDRRAMTRTVAICLVDAEGERLFSEKEAAKLGDADIETMTKVFAKVMDINGLMDEKIEAAVAAFDGARREGSSTD